jgi:hypothetical protein
MNKISSTPHKKSTNDFYACSLNIHGIYMTFNAKNKIVNKIHFMDEIKIIKKLLNMNLISS